MIWDRPFATLMWFASLVYAGFFAGEQIGVWLVLATTVNLLALHLIDWISDHSINRRIGQLMSLTIEPRLEAMEREVADVKAAQVNIAGAFRGRSVPT